jgi:plasmid stability protein
MKRTTLTLEDSVLRTLKARAARQGKTLGAVVNELLRQALATGARRNDYKLDLRGWDAEMQSGVDILDRDKLFDLTNGR